MFEILKIQDHIKTLHLQWISKCESVGGGGILDLSPNTGLLGQESTALVTLSLFLRQIKGSLTDSHHDKGVQHRLFLMA